MSNLTVERDGATLVLSSRLTVRQHAHRRAILFKLANQLDTMTEGIFGDTGEDNRLAADMILTPYVNVSVQLVSAEGVDFEFLSADDTPEEMARKFQGYLDSTGYELVDDAQRAIVLAQTPADPVQAPKGKRGK